jgi:hypothetical protein
MRMPISLVRRATLKARAPYSPTQVASARTRRLLDDKGSEADCVVRGAPVSHLRRSGSSDRCLLRTFDRKSRFPRRTRAPEGMPSREADRDANCALWSLRRDSQGSGMTWWLRERPEDGNAARCRQDARCGTFNREKQGPCLRQPGLTPIRERRGWVQDDNTCSTILRAGELWQAPHTRAASTMKRRTPARFLCSCGVGFVAVCCGWGFQFYRFGALLIGGAGGGCWCCLDVGGLFHLAH